MVLGKISIVIPAFNEEKNIGRILECTHKQTYKNFEVIVIDDGSHDNTGKICKAYTKKYKNYKYIYKENSGVSDSRNLALKYVKGDYVCFWDADDWIGPDYLKEFIQSATLTPNPEETIFVAGCTIDSFNKKKKLEPKTINLDNRLITKKELMASFIIQHEKYRLELWNKLFPIKIIKKHKFKSKLILGEDFEFFTQCLRDIRYLLTVDNNSYHYIIDVNQIKHHTKFNEEVEREKYIQNNLIKAGLSTETANIFYFRRLLITAYTSLSYLHCSKNETLFILSVLERSHPVLFKPFANYKKAQYIMLALMQFNSPMVIKEYFKVKNKIKMRKRK